MIEGRVHVLLYARSPQGRPEAVEEAYHQISRTLSGTDGLLGNRLLRDLGGDGGFVVMSEWRSVEAFRTWEQGADHRSTTAPLRPFQDRQGRAFGVYEVIAAYGGDAPPIDPSLCPSAKS
jgi:heme-degrading monooxygenase HmoA